MKLDLNKIVFTTKNIIEGGSIIYVYHDLSDDWQFFGKDKENIDEDEARILSIKEILEMDITLKEVLISLPVGFEAYRSSKNSQWIFSLSR